MDSGTLAFVQDGRCRLLSRDGNPFLSFVPSTNRIPQELKAKSAIPHDDAAAHSSSLTHHRPHLVADLFSRFYVRWDIGVGRGNRTPTALSALRILS